ncbi:glycosyltransferase [Pontibacter diazotrophicus]|uniref:Glycosyltransferase n=1 Tax=Pontibacter diazotrophicus TaxID=1400979 RepID=A0A3D8L9A2_9BACT|nr:glycosyltransferase [Pontibacter diazotrophicus]RDV13923.1 glycosyltransferase [Pontibacter diazotrophicus]
MSEKRILIASLLKPINDTRMYEKLAVSLSKLSGVQVHVCGYKAPVPPDAPATVAFHPLFHFNRLSLGRVKAQVFYYQLLQELQPDLIIACTHELLLASHLYCRQHSCKLVYDVQENYALNIKAQDNYPPLLKQGMALGLRSIEKSLASQIAHFMVAERSYVEELPFLGSKYTVIENKYQPAAGYTPPATPVVLQHEPLRLLYSGTIGRVYGIFEAIALAEQLHQLEPQTTLTIIGYCADKATYQEVLRQLQHKPYISLIGGDRLVPHQQIIAAIEESNLGLLPYQPNESTFRCIPTKLYEYTAHALPMVVQHNPLWHAFLQQHQAGVSIDYMRTAPSQLLQEIRNLQFYKPGVPAGVFWESEETKLLQLIKGILT